MKATHRILFILSILPSFIVSAQEVEELLAAGIDDAQTFARSYLAPANDGLVYSLSGGWFNTAGPYKQFGFEISAIVNVSLVPDEAQSFILDINDYENLRFANPGITTQEVSTALGNIDGVDGIIEGPLPGTADDVVFTFPTGLLEDTTIDAIPAPVIQATFNIFRGTSLKARFLPSIDFGDEDEGNIDLFGVGIQQDFTAWLPADKIFPVAISGVIGYTNLNATFGLSDSNLGGNNQRLESSTDSWLFQAVAATKLPVINFYGGIGFVTGNTESALLGTYEVSAGVLAGQTLTDPFSIENSTSGVRGTLGFKLKLGFFRLHGDYNFAAFNSATLGLNFGFR